MTTGQRIKAARQQAGLTQTELADKLGIPFQSISQWERDTRKPKQETLLKIAKALGVHLRDLSNDSWLEELDRQLGPERLTELRDGVARYKAINKYLEEMGFTVSEEIIKWHDEEADDEGQIAQVPDEWEYTLSKDGHTATFTDAEFKELQAEAKAEANTRVKEIVESRFYKKVLEQQNK